MCVCVLTPFGFFVCLHFIFVAATLAKRAPTTLKSLIRHEHASLYQ